MIFTFDSSQPGAPAFSGSAGTMRAVLKACLVDGFGAGAVTSLTVAGGVATASFSGAHPYSPGRVVEVSGAVPAGLNGRKVVSTTTTGSITFPAPGVPDGAATGTITAKVASAGWQELFPGSLANVLAIKPSVPEATGVVLRVNDTGATNARLRAFESMSDINTGLGSIPLESQVSGGVWWPKSSAADTTARAWWLVADERGFYFCVAPVAGGASFTVMYAGDIASLKSGDPYGYLLTGNQGDFTSAVNVPHGCCGYSHRSARGGAYLARAYTALGQSVDAQRLGAHHNGSSADVYAGSAGYSVGAYPNGANNGLLFGALEIYSQGLRGELPGLLHPVQDVGAAFTTGSLIAGTDDMAGRTLLVIRVGPSSSSPAGTVMIDLTGPWKR